MTISNQQLQQDYALTSPAAHVIAQSIVSSRKGLGLWAPPSADLTQAITGIPIDFTMQGAPQLEIDISDERWQLMDSGFFDADEDGRLDNVDLNYPQGSKYWWRLRQISPQADYTVATYWIPRVVAELLDLHGPVKVARSSRTRAQFLQMLCDRVPEIVFHCKQLDVVQPIANVRVPTSTSAGSAADYVGLTAKATKGLTVKGSPITASQRDQAGVLLRVADQQGAGSTATRALVYAAIWESSLSTTANNGSYWGVLSGAVDVWQQTDTVGMATAFLRGNSAKGFQGGGAIILSRSTSDPIQVAVQVEVPSIWPANAYAQESGYPGDTAALQEVDAIIQAGGGATGSGGVQGAALETVQQYNFEIGTDNDANEDFWTGMNRLAQEVNWELVVDGPDIYYDSDVTLCRMPLADTIDRTDPAVADWSYDWDNRHIVTNFQLVLVCGEFDYRQGTPVRVTSFGAASTGSTVGLPGRWLISEIERNAGDIMSTLTLVQPTSALKEPAPTVSNSGGVGGGSVVGDYASGSVLAAVQAAQRLSAMGVPYVYGGSHGAGQIGVTNPATLRSQGMDCSSSTSWVLAQAGMFDGQTAQVSGDYETWGDPGPGQQMTVWCSSFHVFLEFNVPNVGHYQLNTSVPGHDGPFWAPWGPNGSTDAASGQFVARHYRGS